MIFSVKDTVSITFSSVAGVNKFSSAIAYTSAVTGAVGTIGMTSWGVAAGANTKVRFYKTSTAYLALKVSDPTTAVGGASWTPRPQVHNTTGAVMGSSMPGDFLLTNERLTIRCAGSSGMCSKTVTFAIQYY